MSKLFCCHGWKTDKDWGFWFRILDKGLVISTMQPSFSERNGYTKTLRIGRVKIQWLKPSFAA